MDREAFLDRIAERLNHPRIQNPPKREPWTSEDLRSPGGPSGISREELAERFKAELEALGGTVYLEQGEKAASDRLRAILQDQPGRKSVSWARQEFACWPVEWLWDQAHCLPWPPEFEGEERRFQWQQAALAAEAGITTAQGAIAETGTLLLCTGVGRPRSASLLPQHHIALIHRSQVVPRLGDALATVASGPGQAAPSGCFFITGPSRTSDIENDLTIGVHGPARLSVIVA